MSNSHKFELDFLDTGDLRLLHINLEIHIAMINLLSTHIIER